MSIDKIAWLQIASDRGRIILPYRMASWYVYSNRDITVALCVYFANTRLFLCVYSPLSPLTTKLSHWTYGKVCTKQKLPDSITGSPRRQASLHTLTITSSGIKCSAMANITLDLVRLKTFIMEVFDTAVINYNGMNRLALTWRQIVCSHHWWKAAF